MRVISGRLRGRTLTAPKGPGLRPTSDQVKETLFNMLGRQVVQAAVLDLFAGTGSLGIEALSRQAEQVVFVEKHPRHIRVLQRNLAACGVESASRVYRGDANKILRVLQKEGWQFDLIFLDPPYRQTSLLEAVLRQLAERALVARTGIVVAEHSRAFSPLLPPGPGLTRTAQRRVGDTTLSFYELNLY
jgi:16S rRNA (guanine(966)-N(2))-methyltransferase RsmD